MQKKNKSGSIFIEGMEDFIEANLVKRPYIFMEEFEKSARSRKIPILSAASGSVLAHLVKSVSPKRILEIGTGPGYSLLWLLSAVHDCEIITIDRNREFQIEAANLLQQIQQPIQVKFANEDALTFLNENLKQLNLFDLVFVDCDKILYPEILHILLNSAIKNFIFDNTLWHGRILKKENLTPSDLAIKEFWQILKGSKREWTLFPAGDGLVFSGENFL